MNRSYIAIGSAQFAERATKGFIGGNYSNDGSYVITENLPGEDYSWVDTISRPGSIPQESAPNWQQMTEEEAYKNKAIVTLEDVG